MFGDANVFTALSGREVLAGEHLNHKLQTSPLSLQDWAQISTGWSFRKKKNITDKEHHLCNTHKCSLSTNSGVIAVHHFKIIDFYFKVYKNCWWSLELITLGHWGVKRKKMMSLTLEVIQ